MNIYSLNLSNQKDLRMFIRFPFDLYKDCPQWVPPLLNDARNAFDPEKHPFFKHGELKLFLAEKKGRVIGRIAVMDNRHYNEYLSESTAFFGFYDVIDDAEISGALFDSAFEWARNRGLTKIIGPRGLISTENTGVLVEGFEHRAAVGLAYNYSYYDKLVMGSGFSKKSDSFSGYATADQMMPERLIKIAERIKERRGFKVVHFQDMNDKDAWIPQVLKVLTRSFEVHPGYCPPTQDELQIAADNLLAIADPRLIKLVRKEEQVIGFIFAYHDITAGLQRAKGRLWPIGWLHLLAERRRTKWVNINGVGVLPEYQGMGVNAILYTEIKKSVDQFDFDHVDVVQVGEDNFQSRSDMENMGIHWYKNHRTYERAL